MFIPISRLLSARLLEAPDKGPFIFLKKHALLFAFFIMVPMCGLFAQQVNLQEILQEGTQNYPFLKSKQAEIRGAESRVKSVKTDYLPTLVVQDQYTFSTNNSVAGSFWGNEGSVISPSGGIRPENIYTGTFGSFTSALVDWRVFNFGKVKANVKTAKADLIRSQADFENELFQHQVRIVDAYLVLLINQKLVGAQQQNLERALVFKRVTDAAVGSGMRPGVDSSLASAEYAKAKLLVLESQRSTKAQALRLAELTGQLRDSMQVDTMQFYSQLPVGTSSTYSFLKNPALRFSQSQIDASYARSAAVRKSYLPSVSILGSGWARGSGVSNKDDSFHTSFSSGVDYQVFNYLFGVSTRWNLTNILRVRNDYKTEQFQVERFKELYQTQKLQLDRQSREADMQFQLSMEQARLTPVQLNAAQRAFNQAQARYQSGLTDLFTLAQSVNALNRAEVDKFVTNGNVWRALLMQAAAAGDLSIFLNQVVK
ncbi:TolC family protein [Dyadobacter psychrophilus]|uniref:Outer membrane protein TolC n=1 Tax=Dyadobacter psychrophilus TaxID=651661 RepID=A0A1T5FRE0_9BACT|nr:TolC family protein [Dyadobacter psychrophilus]SKB98743.1 Outer membrane protein TolC [Dyadobacter psychrophilus]